MQYSLQATHITVSDTDRELIDKKLERLEKHLVVPFTTNIRLMRDQHHTAGDVITCRINIEQGTKVLHAERSAATILDAFDEAVAAVTQEARKQQEKAKKHQ